MHGPTSIDSSRKHGYPVHFRIFRDLFPAYYPRMAESDPYKGQKHISGPPQPKAKQMNINKSAPTYC